MNPAELRALADALEPMAKAPRFEDFDVPAFCAWVRAQADAQPVAWRDHVEQRIRGWRQRTMNRSGDRLALDDMMGQDTIDDLIDYVCDEWAAPAAPQAEPCIGNDSACPCQDGDACHYKDAADGTKAWPVPQAEPKRDQPLLDLLAVIHCDGGHHTEAVGIEQSIKDALSAVYVLKGKLAQAEPKREHWNKYFAARAMQPILLAAIQVAGSESRVDFAAAAKSAYRMADEMVKRGRQHD